MTTHLTDDMVYMALNAMCVNDVGLSFRESDEAIRQWFAEHDRRIAEHAWDDGRLAGEMDRRQPLYRSPNPYRKQSTGEES